MIFGYLQLAVSGMELLAKVECRTSCKRLKSPFDLPLSLRQLSFF